jgi:hypothetical protein
VTGGKPIAAVYSHFISSVSAVNPLIAFYDIPVRKGEELFFFSVPDTTQGKNQQHKYGSLLNDIQKRVAHVAKVY